MKTVLSFAVLSLLAVSTNAFAIVNTYTCSLGADALYSQLVLTQTSGQIHQLDLIKAKGETVTYAGPIYQGYFISQYLMSGGSRKPVRGDVWVEATPRVLHADGKDMPVRECVFSSSGPESYPDHE